jgi:hypothetical protein
MTRPQDAETLDDESSREAPPNQIHIEASGALFRRIPLTGLPIPPGHPVEDLLLGNVAERLRQSRLCCRLRDPAAVQLLADSLPAEAVVLESRAGVACREAAIVDVALLAQALEGGVDVLGCETLAQQRPPQLAGRVVAARELLDRALVGRLG